MLFCSNDSATEGTAKLESALHVSLYKWSFNGHFGGIVGLNEVRQILKDDMITVAEQILFRGPDASKIQGFEAFGGDAYDGIACYKGTGVDADDDAWARDLCCGVCLKTRVDTSLAR